MQEPSDTRFDELPLAAKRRIDAVCGRFEEAWRAGRPAVETFAHEVPEGEQAVLLAELLHIDVERRRKCGEQPAAGDYLGLFPGHVQVIHEVFPIEDAPTRLDAAGPESARGSGPAARPPVQPPGYEVLEEIGRGGMGVVWKARHLALKRMVALKFILTGGGAPPRHRERFRREAEVVARLRHPNIVQIYDVGEVDGQMFLALEYAEGGSLRDRLDGAPMAPHAAVQLLEPLARAVQHAHRQGVIHRDLKPANILLAVGGDSIANTNRPLPIWAPPIDLLVGGEPLPSLAACTPKLTDFGLAQLFGNDVPGLEHGRAAGTPSYMSPEQARAGPVGPAADVWALGANLYELLTGRPPFSAASAFETLRLVVTADPTPPSRLQPGVPRDLDTICLKCLQKEPGRRYAGARELARDLRRFLSGEAILARPAGNWERARKWARRRPLSAAAVLLLAVSFLTGLAAGAAALVDAHAGRRAALAEALAARQQADQAERQAARLKAEDGDEEAIDPADALMPGADAGLLVRLAWRQARRGRMNEAASLYARAAQQGPLYAGDRRRYALVRLAMGDRKTYARMAREEMDRCRAGMLSPRQMRAVLGLCTAGAEGLNDPAAALALARQGVQDAANAPPGERQAAHRVWGAVLYRAGRWPEALEALRNAGAKDAGACALRAMALLHEGKMQEALEQRAAMRRAQAVKDPLTPEGLQRNLLCGEAERVFAARGE